MINAWRIIRTRIIILLLKMKLQIILKYSNYKQNQPRMSDMNSSLIGFLKKKSLFSNSPDKNRRSRQNSRDSKRPGQSQRSMKLINNINHNPQKNNRQSNNVEFINFQKHNSVQNILNTNFQQPLNNSTDMQIESPIRQQNKNYQSNYPDEKKKTIKRNFNFRQQTEEAKVQRQKQKQKQKQKDVKNIWAGIVTKSITFESARLQSAQCLQTMSIKLQTQISSINFKIDSFRSKIEHILNDEYANLKQKVYIVIERLFEESEANIKSYIKQQERTLAAELNIVRENLIKQYERIEQMKQQLNKPNWKKVAGQLLASDLEEKIDNLLLKSKSITIRHWELNDFGQTKLPGFQREIRNLVKLKAS